MYLIFSFHLNLRLFIIFSLPPTLSFPLSDFLIFSICLFVVSVMLLIIINSAFLLNDNTNIVEFDKI